MKLVVLGASGLTGHYIVREALCRGHTVNALVKKLEHNYYTDKDNLLLSYADACDDDSLTEQVRGYDAVISCLEASYKGSGLVTLHSESVSALTEAMLRCNVPRLIVISSWGVEDPFSLPWQMKYFTKSTRPQILRDLWQMERFLREETPLVHFTAVRVPILTNSRMSGSQMIMEPEVDHTKSMKTHLPRANLAACVLDMVEKSWFLRNSVSIGLRS